MCSVLAKKKYPLHNTFTKKDGSKIHGNNILFLQVYTQMKLMAMEINKQQK